jgi:hypothetical protein
LVDKVNYGEIILAPGASTTWWHTWTHINTDRWVWFSAVAVSDNGSVEITRQWSEKTLKGFNQVWCTFKNIGTTPVRFVRYAVSI